MRALEAGKHVLCEKPLSRHPDEVARAFDVAERAAASCSPRRSCGATTRRRSRLLELLEQIGELRLVRASFSFLLRAPRRHPPAGGARRRRADGRRLLLRQRRAPARRRAARGAAPSRCAAATASTCAWPPCCASPATCSRRSTAASTWPRATSSRWRGRDGVLWLDDPWHSRSARDRAAPRATARSSASRSSADPYACELEDFAAAVAGERAPLLRPRGRGRQARAIAALYASAEAGEPREVGR